MKGRLNPTPSFFLVLLILGTQSAPRGVTQNLWTRLTMAGARVQLSVTEPRGSRRKAGKQGALRVEFFFIHIYSHSFHLRGLECCFDVSGGCARHVAFM